MQISAHSLPDLLAERAEIVLKARDGWKRQLMDLSRRNNLLYFRELRAGTLRLDGLDGGARRALLGGAEVSPLSAFPEEERARAAAALREIWRRARSNLEERGLETLFLAFGMASWNAVNGGRPPAAPVLLMPVSVSYRGSDPRNATIKRVGDLRLNPALVQVLRSDFGCRVDEEALLPDLENGGEQTDISAIFGELRAIAREVPGFSIADTLVVGNFAFQRMAMVRDLDNYEETLVSNELIAAIAGDPLAQASLQREHREIDPRELDSIPPEDEWLILKSDSSQRVAIEAARRGQHLVISGPPGTGKSQTIANLIAVLAAEGKRVLFVAEKRAALDVVLQRLTECGLDHLVLDIHAADISKREIINGLRRSNEILRTSTDVCADECNRQFAERRAALNAHDRRMHMPRPPAGLSLYEIMGRLLQMPPETACPVRWRGAELLRLDGPAADRVQHLLTRMAGLTDIIFGTSASPWRGAWFSSGEEANRVQDTVAWLSGGEFARYKNRMAALASACGFPAPHSPAEVGRMLELVKHVEEVLTVVEPMIFDQDLELALELLRPALGSRLRELKLLLLSSRFRKMRKLLLSLERHGHQPLSRLYDHSLMAARVRREWRTISGNQAAKPAVPREFNEARAHHASVAGALSMVSAALRTGGLDALGFEELGGLLSELSADRVTPYRIVSLKDMVDELTSLGTRNVFDFMISKGVSPELWPSVFRRSWLESMLEEASASSPDTMGFNGRAHDRVVEEFRRLDDERLRLARARVRRQHALRAIDTMNRFPSQAAVVKRELKKATRHKPLRALMAEAPDVLTALCPCWMASPLSVSNLIDASRTYFDYVIFDEASQILPETAIPALMRARHAIVAGDRNQLPPTTFFSETGDEELEEEPSTTSGFESILDVMSAFVETRSLDWHYRSRDEALIAFSNRHIYSDRLVTFPGCGKDPALSLVLVEATLRDTREESSAEEVRKVVELILEHARHRPDESLGVIALGIKHAKRIQMALDEVLERGVDCEEFFNPERREPFFIKNLERVQGDERDAIILSIGYGKTPDGRLYYHFGPLLHKGGERRLNVAITRARCRMTVVSSFSHLDMDPARSDARGVQLLRAYLEYVSTQGRTLGDRAAAGGALNAFEADVYETLRAKGIPLVPQWGVSGYRIDMAAQHPSKPGRFVLAIECDGASYHSAPMARDRDRLRQERLEALGWRFHRIWSLDWFMRRDEEVRRAVEAYRRAVEAADALDCSGMLSVGRSPALTDLSAPKRREGWPNFVADRGGPREPGDIATGQRWMEHGAKGIERSAQIAGGHAARGMGEASVSSGGPEALRDGGDPWRIVNPARQRGPPPPVRRVGSVEELEPEEVRAVVLWVLSDGVLRTDDEIVAEAARALGFSRVGSRIESRVRNELEAIKRAGGYGPGKEGRGKGGEERRNAFMPQVVDWQWHEGKSRVGR
ncbi:MAG: AAA domain-containing protein [Thermoplasmata archaeon]